MKLSSFMFKRLQEETFRGQKIKIPTLRKFLIFLEMELSCPKLKKA